MLDAPVRRALAPTLDAAARRLDALGVPADAVTATAWLAGMGACVAAGTRQWPLALALWLANRLGDGLDGPLARVRGASDRGGFLDVVGDFSVYGGFLVGVAVGVPAARLACLVLLATYYVSGTAFLALSSLAERHALALGDDRSLRFVGGLAEGTETAIVYVLICLLPARAAPIAWAFAVVVAITAIQRVTLGLRMLRRPATRAEGPPPPR